MNQLGIKNSFYFLLLCLTPCSYTVTLSLVMKKTPSMQGGKHTPKRWRPTSADVAALEVLADKLKVQESNVIRLALHRLVDFEGVRDQVARKATLLEKRVVSSVG